MTVFRYFTVFLCLLGSCAGLSAQESLWTGYGSREESPVSQNTSENPTVDKRFYLLKTGYLLEGEAQNDGTHYEVKTDFGGMRIPMDNVEFVAGSREEIYRYKKDKTESGNVSERTKLAEWCFANGLAKEGIAEYEQVLPLAPNPLMADFIRKRLDTVKDPTLDALDAVHNPFPSTETPTGSDPELARWTREMPQSVVDAFTKRVQPILVSRCASASCHGSNSDNQYKIRIPRQAGGTTTYRNLKATVEWINLEHPTDSPVLSALVTPHGGVRAPFDIESRQYQRVVDWIQLTTKEIPLELNEQLLARFKDQKNLRSSVKTPMPKSAPQDSETLLPPGFDDVSGYQPTRLVVPNTPVDVDTPDPFDPLPFNVRYHPAIVKSALGRSSIDR